ncbi:Clp protease N-terminal domain-containing protein [Paenarthrobacter sp. YJN-5]|uniref:Clp protease N-terminal domain-containing protein n=1 Tax=Paenarthrobacter sp. YJN-5 TaxID=2735316 RepID=UPI00187896A4|nr:Clp protease N-terminal domain-containing protein [Paenarthrobacter sp. YJN-5]QOT19554.1 Clp protease [Paenarthrobacter sp. YJN-5]
MFEKFDDAARSALLMAKDIAAKFNQDHINTSHLLLAVTGYTSPEIRWHNPPGISPKTEAVIAALGTTPDTVIGQTVAAMKYGTSYDDGRHHPFTPNLKQVLEYALRASMMLGDNHVGPEHLLAGLARNSSGTAGAALLRLGVTDLKIHTAIQDSTPAPSPTAARPCAVYLPVGKSIFKNGGKIYPDLATAQAAHPDQDIAPFVIQLAEGEFFDVGTVHQRFSSWGRFASFSDAFAAAEKFRDVQGADVQIRILVPDVTELRGKDSAGRDVVLGRSVEYTHVKMMSRIGAAQPAAEAASA